MRASETERHERATDEPWDDQQRDGIHVVSPLRTRLRRADADGSPALLGTPNVVGDAKPQALDEMLHRERLLSCHDRSRRRKAAPVRVAVGPIG
jgi:hypothetical protein